MHPNPPRRAGNAIRPRRASLKAFWPVIAGRSLCLITSSRSTSKVSIFGVVLVRYVRPFAHNSMYEGSIYSLWLHHGNVREAFKFSLPFSYFLFNSTL